MGPRAGPVWTGGKSRPHRDSIPDRLSRSQSLHRLSYIQRRKGQNSVYHWPPAQKVHITSARYKRTEIKPVKQKKTRKTRQLCLCDRRLTVSLMRDVQNFADLSLQPLGHCGRGFSFVTSDVHS